MSAIDAIRALHDADILQPVALKQIYEMESKDMAPALSEAFFPTQSFNSEKQLAAARYNRASGFTNFYAGGMSEPVNMNGGVLRIMEIPAWEDVMRFGRSDLVLHTVSQDGVTGHVDPEEIANMAVKYLTARINNRKEKMATEALRLGKFQKAGSDLFDLAMPNTMRLDLNDSASTDYTDVRDLPLGISGWAPALWSSAASADPQKDLTNIMSAVSMLWGIGITEIWMHPVTVAYMLQTAAVKTFFQHTAPRAAINLNTFADFLGIPMVSYGASYDVTTHLTAAASSTATSITVADYTNIEDNDTIMFLDKDSGEYSETRVTATPSTTTVAVSALPVSVANNSIVTVRKPVIKPGYVYMKTDITANSQAMVMIPSDLQIINGEKAGPYFYTDMSDKKGDPSLVVTSGFKGGPVAFQPGGMITLKVT